MHLHIHSIERYIEELKVELELRAFKFDILCFSESKIVNGETPKININFEDYQDPVSMPTKATKGGVLIYMKNGINFIPRNDSEIEKVKNSNLALLKYLTTTAKIQ